MREEELRKKAKCIVCGEKFGHTGLPSFWEVTVARHGLDVGAVQRQQALGLMIGAPLAQVMGPDEDMTEPLLKLITGTICETCASEKRFNIFEIYEFLDGVGDHES